jgi:hypothetical protein
VAASYAVALAESAQASNTLDQIHADVETFAAYSLSNAGIASVLANPVLSDAKKKDLVAKIAKEGSFSPVFVNFLNLLITKRRINLINQVLLSSRPSTATCPTRRRVPEARGRTLRASSWHRLALRLRCGIGFLAPRYPAPQRLLRAPLPRAFRRARQPGRSYAVIARRCAPGRGGPRSAATPSKVLSACSDTDACSRCRLPPSPPR